MKLRIRGNTVRLRLEKGEVNTFAADSQVVDRAPLSIATPLEYGLRIGDLDELTLHFTGQELIIVVPRSVAQAWTDSDQVGIEAQVAVGQDSVKILIEKDFRCLHKRPGEDESGNYPHPAEVD